METGVTVAFSTPRKLRPNVCTKCLNFDEAVLRKIVHHFYLTEKRPTLKEIHSKIRESTGYESVTSLVLRKMGFR